MNISKTIEKNFKIIYFTGGNFLDHITFIEFSKRKAILKFREKMKAHYKLYYEKYPQHKKIVHVQISHIEIDGVSHEITQKDRGNFYIKL